MSKLKKLFGEFNFTWPKVIIFAVICAVFTALINEVPFLEDTSFQDIAISYECWILFALLIISNCKKWWEASLKCFVFFLISQPLIYLIEVPFESLGWGIFMYYKPWFYQTLLTLPGAALAYQLKRKNFFSALVLSVATGGLAYLCVGYINSTIANFPHHLLSAVFCFVSALLYIFIFLDKKRHRFTVLIISAVIFITAFIVTGVKKDTQITLEAGQWTYELQDESIAEVKITDGNKAVISPKNKGSTYLYFINKDGQREEYYITVSGNEVTVNRF